MDGAVMKAFSLPERMLTLTLKPLADVSPWSQVVARGFLQTSSQFAERALKRLARLAFAT